MSSSILNGFNIKGKKEVMALSVLKALFFTGPPGAFPDSTSDEVSRDPLKIFRVSDQRVVPGLHRRGGEFLVKYYLANFHVTSKFV
jgi:hypothetical protein